MTEAPAEPKPIYSIGTLNYTFRGLILLMVWLLWGDFCFSLMEGVFPSVVPVMLGKLAAPDWVIALFLSTIPNLLNATVCPVVSFWSDRYRSPLGRRIPFILNTIPFLCLFLVLLGLGPALGDWLYHLGWGHSSAFNALLLIGVFAVGYQFFNMFVASVYYYLFNDVVPHQFLGRFLATFRVVGVVANAFFFFFIFPKAEAHFAEIFIGAAVLYGIVFFFMCRKVKEGDYPPPPDAVSEAPFLSSVSAFFKECFSSRYYWLFYLAAGFSAVALAGEIFLLYFAYSVGLTLDQFGTYKSFTLVISSLLFIPCGILCDRFHPLRTTIFATFGLSITALLPLAFLIPVLATHPLPVWWVVFGISIPFAAQATVSSLPMYMEILPKERFGQFSAATALVRSVMVLVGGQLCGILIGWIKTSYLSEPAMAYRFLPLWTASFQGLTAVCLLILYKWKPPTRPQHSVCESAARFSLAGEKAV